MFPKPRADLVPNTADFERVPLVKPTGFREYDARWLFPQDINLMGLNAIGLGLATLAGRRGVPKRFVVGHDYRSYSGQVKQALMMGLLAGGAQVHDIGLAMSPMAYFAQFELEVEGVAMVTASHNDNGWTGIKMGFSPSAHVRPRGDDGAEGASCSAAQCETAPGGAYVFVPDMAERYIKALTRAAQARSASSRWWRPAATARPAPGHRACWRRSAARWCRSTASSTTPSRATIRTPKT